MFFLRGNFSTTVSLEQRRIQEKKGGGVVRRGSSDFPDFVAPKKCCRYS